MNQFEKAIDFIEGESPLRAEKVKLKIILKINSLPQHPEKYYPDKYKIGNDGTYRAFLIYHYRITYRVKMMRSGYSEFAIPGKLLYNFNNTFD